MEGAGYLCRRWVTGVHLLPGWIHDYRYSTLSCPTGLIASGATTTTIDLDWDNEPAAVTYQLKYREFNTPPWTIVNVGTNSTTLTGLTIGTTYQWRLKSVCAADGSIVSTNSPTPTFATAASRVGEVDVAVVADQDIAIYSHKNSIYINFADSELANSQIQIYDLSGRMYSHIDNSIELRQRLENTGRSAIRCRGVFGEGGELKASYLATGVVEELIFPNSRLFGGQAFRPAAGRDPLT